MRLCIRESIFLLLPKVILKQGIYYLTFVVAGVYPIFNQINQIEIDRHAHLGDFANSDLTDSELTELAKEKADAAIAGNLSSWQLVVIKIFMCGLPLILFIIVYILIKKKYIISEEYYRNMVKTIDERKRKEVINIDK